VTTRTKCIATSDLGRYADALEAESSESRALARDLENNPICSLTIDYSVPCVCVTWKRYATSPQFRFIHESIIKLLAEHGLSKVIGDDTSLPTIHPQDQAWIISDWMPRAIAAGLRSAAGKLPALYFGKASVEQIRMSAPPGITIRHFRRMAEARAWITRI
jgi:hypothetical protein